MQTYTFEGQIEITKRYEVGESDRFTRIVLIGQNGLRQDLVNRASELKESFQKKLFQINYWVSEKPQTKDQMIEAALHKIYSGKLNGEYHLSLQMGSSMTGMMDWSSTYLSIGGHDLVEELSKMNGKYMIIEFNILDPK